MNRFSFSSSSKLKVDKMKLNTIIEEIIDDDVSSFIFNILF